jgi:hypothetical protein
MKNLKGGEKMDRKMLELMEEKAEKARGIIEKIDSLSNDALKIEECEGAEFYGIKNDVSIDVSNKELLEQFKLTFVNAALKEIEKLEKELVEL